MGYGIQFQPGETLQEIQGPILEERVPSFRENIRGYMERW